MAKYKRALHTIKPDGYRSFSEVVAYSEKHFTPLHTRQGQIERLSGHIIALKRDLAGTQVKLSRVQSVLHPMLRLDVRSLNQNQKGQIKEGLEIEQDLKARKTKQLRLLSEAFEKRRLLYPLKDSMAWFVNYADPLPLILADKE